MPKSRIVKKFPKKFAGISEDISMLMKGILSVDPNSDDVNCIPIILEKIITLKKLLMMHWIH
jgi:hypothetical protein